MSRLFYHVCQDNAGNLLFNVQGTMRLAGTGTNATIYGDEALTVILPNPMTNHASFGSFKCFLGAGDYDFYMAKSGYTFETLTGVQGHGTMAQQDAASVAITGGTITADFLASNNAVQGAQFVALDTAGEVIAFRGQKALGTNRWNVYMEGTANNYLNGNTGFGIPTPPANARLFVLYPNSSMNGAIFQPSVAHTGSFAIAFNNLDGSGVGGIITNASSTSYNTTSDARLKHAITPLTGAIDVIRALTPVSYLWNADGSPGQGLLAGDVQEVIPDGVVSGDKDAVDDAGQIVPQMIDYSKLVPWLVSACQDLAQQVEALTAQLEAARP